MNDPKKGWKYAGDAETTDWKSWKDHSNNQGTDGLGKSLFDYRDETPESISSSQKFPDNHFQENPEKM